MSEYDDTNRGAIWKNDKKERETQPDFRGTLNVGGVEYWVSAWKRKPDARPNSPALSFSVEAKDKRPAEQSAEAQATGGGPVDDEIPFSQHERGRIA